jgi:two-component system CheB/CheR fusion protein
MVVDDNADAANSLAMLLELEGHEVEPVYTSQQALTRAQLMKPEVVLLDIGLPEIDGYEVARRLRALPATARTRLIALSGYGQNEDKERSRAAGFDHHLTKPVDFAMLQKVLAATGAERNISQDDQ